MPLLDVDTLGITAGDSRVVEALSFRLGQGIRLGLVGAGGTGKSLIALAIAGLLPSGTSRSGAIRFEGAVQPSVEANLARWRGRRMAVLPQAGGLDPLQPVGAQIAEALAPGAEDRPQRVAALLADVGLEPGLARAYPDDLNPGQRQQALIAIALAAEPVLLIADEPLAPLDPPAQRRVLDLLRAASDSRGMALLFISHDLKAVASLCNEVMVLQDGRAVDYGPVTEVLGRPQHDYTKELVAAGRHRARTLMRSPIGTALLEVRGLGRRFPAPRAPLWPRAEVAALDDVSFVLRRSECLAVVGPAGSGKTTLARIVAGLDRASGGTIEMEHHAYRGSDLPAVLRRQISMVFADARASFDAGLSVGASVTEPLRLEPQLLIEEQADRLVEAVRAVGLDPADLVRLPASFSDGDMVRLAFARALVAKPRLVVFDEPVAALDVALRGEMLMLLNRLRADFGLTALVMSRDLDTARAIADRVLVLGGGSIVESGKPAELIESPQHPLTQALVAARLPEVAESVRVRPEA